MGITSADNESLTIEAHVFLSQGGYSRVGTAPPVPVSLARSPPGEDCPGEPPCARADGHGRRSPYPAGSTKRDTLGDRPWRGVHEAQPLPCYVRGDCHSACMRWQRLTGPGAAVSTLRQRFTCAGISP